MDSECMTKISENETSQSDNEQAKESVTAVANSEESERRNINDNINDVKADAEMANQTSHFEEDDKSRTETEATITSCISQIESVQNDPQTERTTMKTVVVSKNQSPDIAAQTESKTITKTTLVVSSNEGEDEASKAQTKTTTTTVVVSKIDDAEGDEINETVSNVVVALKTQEPSQTGENAEKKTVQEPDQKAESDEKPSVGLEQNEEQSEESDNSEDEESLNEEKEDYVDDENKDLEDEPEKEEIEEARDESPISAKSEMPAEEKIGQDEKAYSLNKDINNQIENIISDIDINIKAQEKITQLKEQELHLIQKQKELASQIQQQQLLAQKLIAQNQLKEQELREQQQQQQLLQQRQLQNHSQHNEESTAKVNNAQVGYTALYNHEDSNITKESSNISRTVDLRKIFTPATDAPQILPKNRKLYASSAFYSPTLHPTVEDQVELARRISHSLSDISNQTSKGQSMYVNRKKRSVKWVHEGCGQGEDDIVDTCVLSKENTEDNLQSELTKLDKMPLKLVMNPWGQMRDYNSLKDSINIESGLLSPDNCAELITALQLQKGRGAELFAKRRRKADNWVVDETNAGTHSPSGIPDYQQYQANRLSAVSPSILPAYSDAGKHRVQLNLHQDQLIEKYSKPGVQVVKSPWDAALQTGSASSAFIDQSQYRSQNQVTAAKSPVQFQADVPDFPFSESTPDPPFVQDLNKNSLDSSRARSQPIQPCNPQRELAYKPCVAQGWGGRNVELPREYCCQIFHKDCEQCHSDDMGEYSFEPNKQILVDPGYCGMNTHFHRIDELRLNWNLNEKIQHRLQQLEQFQRRFMQQQNRQLSINKWRSSESDQEGLGSNGLIPVKSYLSSKLKVEVENPAEVNETVNVRELIHTFEQQSLSEPVQAPKHQVDTTPDIKLSQSQSSIAPTNKVNQSDENTNKGLYVPKEISLASYAPPPTLPGLGVQQTARNSQSSPNVDVAKGYGRAPINFPTSDSTSALFSTAPPKQALYSPSSYQKVPTSLRATAPQMNFTPSPLSSDKLSKFQENEQAMSGQRYLNINKQPVYNRGVQNASPTPFMPGGFPISSPSTKPTSPQLNDYAQNIKYSARLQGFRGGSQSFNKCARGWSNTSQNVYSRNMPASTESLPYSDF